MRDFVAIDVETANNHPTSICAVGAIKIVDGCIACKFYEMVKPEPEYFNRYFTEHVHGISITDVEDARNFKEVWTDLHNLIIGDLPLVAHNKKFDEGMYNGCFQNVWDGLSGL